MSPAVRPARRRLQRLRRLVGYGAASLIIVAGLLVATISQLLPLLERDPQAVAAWISQRVGRPVAISALTARWERNGPLLDLSGFTIGAGDEQLSIGRAALRVDLYAGLLPGRPLASLQLDDLDLTLERDPDGRWRLHGIVRQSTPFELSQLDGLGELLIEHATLTVEDAASGQSWLLPRLDARLRAQGGRLQFAAAAYADGLLPLRINGDIETAHERGRLYVQAEQLDLAAWAAGIAAKGLAIRAGTLSTEVWLDIDAGEIVAGEFDTRALSLTLAQPLAKVTQSASNEPAQAQLSRPVAASLTTPVLPRVSAPAAITPSPMRGRFARTPDGWKAGIDADDGAWIRAAQQGASRHIEAGAVEISDLIALLPPSSTAEMQLVDRLREAAARGRIESLRAEFQDDTLQRLDARLHELGATQVGERPGFSGLSATVQWQDQQLAAHITSPNFVIEWPVALREPLPMALAGTVDLLKPDAYWQLATDQLTARGSDFAFDVAGSLTFDGKRPSSDLRAVVFEGPIVAAKRFWMLHRMPPTAVKWLDESLLDGRLLSGHLLLTGDLDHWPFAGNEGRLIAEAEVADVSVRYLPDWPIATNLNGRATFLNRSIGVDVASELLGNHVQRAVGGIASTKEPRLLLDISGGGSGADLMNLLRSSPLQKKYADSFDAISVGGEAAVALSLDIPLAKRLGAFSMRGTAQLSEADLRDSRWGIALDAAQGELRFSERGLDADAIEVLYSGQPARFAIALGSHTEKPQNAVESSLQGRLSVDTLLDFQPGLSWLKPHMEGTSDWRIAVALPLASLPIDSQADGPTAAAVHANDAQADSGAATSAAAPGDSATVAVIRPLGAAQLSIRSDLVGTTLSLPAPLSKAASVRLPLRALATFAPTGVDAPMALDLHLGSLLRLYGQLGEEASFNGVAAFGESDEVLAPTRGLRVVGQVPVIDASAWAAMAASSATGEGVVVDVDLFAGVLDMLDRSFAETRVRMDRPAAGELRLRFAGPALDGEIEVPAPAERITRGITARLARLHWPSVQSNSAITDLIDPGAVPAFHLWVQELHMGEANLGETRLETFPQNGGMRVDLFESKSSALQLFGRGDWTRVDGISRSNFEIEFTASELGGMLKALGFSELIEGGQTFAKLRASWPGPPAAFAMQNVDGGLEISVGQGRVPQVNPGAGRLLGLFSLTEIPRRLSLDFSDFFRSGLAFNKITGSFVFADGNAVTDDLTIDSPAAEIRIRGRTGLRAQDYTQTMEVLPRTGSVLPVVGALAAGPAGAAIGAVAQAVLQRPFKQINRTLYRVEGPWAEPVLEVLERGPARDAAEEAGP
ncbi:MAG: YhdP family phospholipid transporter [Pseudomarimonas sp.]